MIYVCVPVHNEARTAGLVLWKVRQVFTGFSREYQILVCDDASTDDTAEVLGRYARVLPMTVITNRERQGYAKSLEALLMTALQRTDRPKRDCAITLHADFVHSPEAMEEMVKRLESGADLVVGEQKQHAGAVKRGFRWCRAWAPRLLRVPGVRDTVSGFVALRLVVLRQALRPGAETLLTTDGWAANAELVARLIRHARKLETVGYSARYDLRQRASRTTGLDELMRAWRARPAVRAARLAMFAALMLFSVPRARAQTPPAADSNAAAPATRPVPFPIGEHLVFQAKYGFINVGTATMDVSNIDTIRGTPTVHLVFHILGSALFGAYKLDQKLESWVGKDDFVSRRYKVDTDEKGKRWGHTYDIFP
ncbi:MAG TPA: glycosyltransferase, partial [Gemmatimonadales bacterium]|nr:glycosyltransferase [Gemmatimonadales bacterium]